MPRACWSPKRGAFYMRNLSGTAGIVFARLVSRKLETSLFIFRKPLNQSSSAVSGSFPPAHPHQKREIWRSRCSVSWLTDAAYPLRVHPALLPFGTSIGRKSLTHSSCQFIPCFLRIPRPRRRKCVKMFRPARAIKLEAPMWVPLFCFHETIACRMGHNVL